MGLTNHPHGVSSFGMPVIGSGEVMTTGNVFFVQSTHVRASNDNAATDPQNPAATAAGGIAKCTANNGDFVFVMPGHAEDLTTTTSLDVDVAGITVMGLGTGNSRPVFSTTTTTGEMRITASNVRWSNMVHSTEVEGSNGIFVGAGGAIEHVEIDNCFFTFLATGNDYNMMIRVGDGATDSADYTYIHDCWFNAESTNGCSAGILLDDSDNCRVINNIFRGDFSGAAIDGAAASSVANQMIIAGNIIDNRETAGAGGGINTAASANGTGIISNNLMSYDLAAPENAIAATPNCDLIENFSVDDTHTVSAARVPEATAT